MGYDSFREWPAGNTLLAPPRWGDDVAQDRRRGTDNTLGTVYPQALAWGGAPAPTCGAVWTARTSAADNEWRGLAWAAELGLLVAVSTTGSGNRIMTSPNGIDWTARTSATDNDWRGVTWAAGLGLLVAVSTTGSGNRVMTSPNGIDWTARTSAADNNWPDVTWAAELGLLVAVSTTGSGNRVMTSN
jgi:hypothetical protein